MATTPNYNLFITDDANTKFIDWRRELSGVSDSNMTKIDTALGEKAQKSELITGVLSASAWSGVDSPYTQVLAVTGLTADQNGTISVAQNATIEQREAARMAMLAVIRQSEGTLTIAADGEMPDIDIPVVVILLG